MIGRIKGIVIEKVPPELVVDVQGIGYELQVSMNTFYRLPEVGHAIDLFTHFVVREDAQLLYGFYEAQERSLFRFLIKTNGVGPKLALAILSGIEVDEFVRVVRRNDAAALEKLPGIGKKTAERLIIEMRDRLKDWQDDQDGAPVPMVNAASSQAIEEAESALLALGYKPREASRVVKNVAQDNMTSQELIRQALKLMVKA